MSNYNFNSNNDFDLIHSEISINGDLKEVREFRKSGLKCLYFNSGKEISQKEYFELWDRRTEKEKTEYSTIKNVPAGNLVGAYFNKKVGSDSIPFEIIAQSLSGKQITVRSMKVSDNLTKMDFTKGGFVAVCNNNDEQSYNYTSDQGGIIFKVRLNKNGWKGGEVSNKPHKFYDYNF